MYLYYLIEKELTGIEDYEQTTGHKDIRVYDIDTQSMVLILICELALKYSDNSKEEIKKWLKENDYENYKLVEL